jgi:uncharacterized repeat protein (TIGR03803 family)
MKIRKRTRFEPSGGVLFSVALLFLAATAIPSSAQTFTTLLDFDGTNGESPSALVQGFDGKLYGTTFEGGANSGGTVFKVTTGGSLTTLYNFCGKVHFVCLDGAEPRDPVLAANGSFYGSTLIGGAPNLGTIFKITAAGKFTSLYTVCSQPPCTDGAYANDMMQGSDGNLYGTMELGGVDLGTVFKLSLTGTLTTLHTFGGPDGAFPTSAPIQATNGKFYGTTVQGGSSTNCNQGCGTVYKLTPSGTLTVLHSFHLSDGSGPNVLIQGTDGNFYGTTEQGGTCLECGTVFKMTASGNLTTLYNFCSQSDCADGKEAASLMEGSDGNFYGTTYYGGNSSNSGTIFEITPQGALTTLYDFCSQQNCADGDFSTKLMQATDGNFYGPTGGGLGWGTVYKLSTGLGPFVKLPRQAGKVGQSGGILGQGFTGTTAVLINGTPASFTVVSDTYIEATIPAGATSGFITVATPTGTLTSNVIFHVGP